LMQSSDQEKSSVSFLPNSTSCGYGRPTLHDLVDDLRIVENVAPYYALAQENCWFFTTIIQEALTDEFSGIFEGEAPSWAGERAPKAREEILLRIYGTYNSTLS